MTNSLHCPICNGTDIAMPYLESLLPIWRCCCGLEFLHPQPAAEELRKIYHEEYYRSWGICSGEEESLQKMKLRTFTSRLQTLSNHKTNGALLDVGCATGYFLQAAQSAGWDVYGVELSEFSAELAEKMFNDRVFQGTLEQAGFSDNRFDVIALSDLLEHIPDLGLFLAEVQRILKPDGVLMIVTPDVSSLSSRLMRRRWSHYKAEHLYYFSPETMISLLMKNGFAPVMIRPASKYLNLTYIANQFASYHHPLLTPLTTLINLIIPETLKSINFPVYCGEMQILAKRAVYVSVTRAGQNPRS